MKNENQPLVNMPVQFRNAPRCGAYSRRTGKPCMAPAMANGKCRLHGGKSTGPPRGNTNALKHGYYTKDAIGKRRYLSRLMRESRETIEALS